MDVVKLACAVVEGVISVLQLQQRHSGEGNRSKLYIQRMALLNCVLMSVYYAGYLPGAQFPWQLTLVMNTLCQVSLSLTAIFLVELVAKVRSQTSASSSEFGCHHWKALLIGLLISGQVAKTVAIGITDLVIFNVIGCVVMGVVASFCTAKFTLTLRGVHKRLNILHRAIYSQYTREGMSKVKAVASHANRIVQLSPHIVGSPHHAQSQSISTPRAKRSIKKRVIQNSKQTNMRLDQRQNIPNRKTKLAPIPMEPARSRNSFKRPHIRINKVESQLSRSQPKKMLQFDSIQVEKSVQQQLPEIKNSLKSSLAQSGYSISPSALERNLTDPRDDTKLDSKSESRKSTMTGPLFKGSSMANVLLHGNGSRNGSPIRSMLNLKPRGSRNSLRSQSGSPNLRDAGQKPALPRSWRTTAKEHSVNLADKPHQKSDKPADSPRRPKLNSNDDNVKPVLTRPSTPAKQKESIEVLKARRLRARLQRLSIAGCVIGLLATIAAGIGAVFSLIYRDSRFSDRVHNRKEQAFNGSVFSSLDFIFLIANAFYLYYAWKCTCICPIPRFPNQGTFASSVS